MRIKNYLLSLVILGTLGTACAPTPTSNQEISGPPSSREEINASCANLARELHQDMYALSHPKNKTYSQDVSQQIATFEHSTMIPLCIDLEDPEIHNPVRVQAAMRCLNGLEELRQLNKIEEGDLNSIKEKLENLINSISSQSQFNSEDIDPSLLTIGHIDGEEGPSFPGDNDELNSQSELHCIVLSHGKGQEAKSGQKVQVHYTGKLSARLGIWRTRQRPYTGRSYFDLRRRATQNSLVNTKKRP